MPHLTEATLLAAGFQKNEAAGNFFSNDDVFETIVEPALDRPGIFAVSIINHEDEEDIAPELNAVVFFVNEHGYFVGSDGIDANTAITVHRALFADDATTCHAAPATFVEDSLCCKVCFGEVAL